MAWTYSNWVTQTTTAAQLVALRAHIKEVSDEISARLATEGKSYDPQPLGDYLKELLRQLATLAQNEAPADLANSARARAAFTRGRPL